VTTVETVELGTDFVLGSGPDGVAGQAFVKGVLAFSASCAAALCNVPEVVTAIKPAAARTMRVMLDFLFARCPGARAVREDVAAVLKRP